MDQSAMMVSRFWLAGGEKPPVGRMQMSGKAGERVGPVDPARFHHALGIYQAALVEPLREGAGGAPADVPVKRGFLAVRREFPDSIEFESLSFRLQRFTEIVSDKKLIKWGLVKHSEGGIEVHDAVINALATAPFRKSGVLDKSAFHALVKDEFTKLEAAEKQ
jgi:hypothetical protein